jgi:hypothetical protein
MVTTLKALALAFAFMLFTVSCGGGGSTAPIMDDVIPPAPTPNLTNFVGGLDPYLIGDRISFLRLELTATSREIGESFGVKVFCTPKGKAEVEITTVTVDNDVRKALVVIQASNEGRPLSKAGYSTYAYVVPMDGTAQPEDRILVSAEVDARDMALFLAEINGWPIVGPPELIPVPDPDPPSGGGDGNSIDVFGWALAGIGIVGAILCPTEYGEVIVTGDAVEQPYLADSTIVPTSWTGHPGDTKQFSGTCLDQNGNAIAGGVVSWSSADSAIATVDANGLVTAVAVGTTTITRQCQLGGKISKATATVNITVPADEPELMKLDLTPATVTLSSGETQRFETTHMDQHGNLITGATCVYSMVSGVGSIDSTTGLYTAPATITTGSTAVVKVICSYKGKDLEDTAIVTLVADEAGGLTWGGDPYGQSESYFVVTPDDGEWSGNLGKENLETQMFFGDLFQRSNNQLRLDGVGGRYFEVRFGSNDSGVDITVDGLLDSSAMSLGTYAIFGKATLATLLDGVPHPTEYVETVTVNIVLKTTSGATKVWDPINKILTLVQPLN